MLRTAGRLLAATLVGAGLATAGLVLDAAQACEGLDCGGGGSTHTDGQTVVVMVSGTLVRGGTPGRAGSTTVAVQPPCYYFRAWSGKEYYTGVENGTISGGPPQLPGYDPNWQPEPGYKSHKDDTEGAYWAGVCTSANYDGDLDGFFDFARDWFDTHDTVWVDAGGQPPVPPIPPTVLRDAALQAMELPEPVFEYNPSRTADQASIVNMDTWFWQDPALPVTGDVTATAGPWSATVTMNLEDVEYSSSYAGAVNCPDGGTAWTRGATSACTLAFDRATPGADVQANSRWTGTWTFNGAPQGAVDPVEATWQTTFPVTEIQSVVEGIG